MHPVLLIIFEAAEIGRNRVDLSLLFEQLEAQNVAQQLVEIVALPVPRLHLVVNRRRPHLYLLWIRFIDLFLRFALILFLRHILSLMFLKLSLDLFAIILIDLV